MSATGTSLRLLYTSVYRHGVDGKRRVQIPSKWRARANGETEEFTLFLWPEGSHHQACLTAFPPAGVNKMVEMLEAMAPDDPNKPILRRFLGENCESVQLDSAGRICLPSGMADAVGIKDKVVLSGQVDRFQIWAPELYEASRQQVNAAAPKALTFFN